jgi:geranylgeranyl diphosphate synthase type II
VSAPPDLQHWLDARRADVDAALDRFVPPAADAASRLVEAMRYSLLAGGKRLRPVLALAAAEAVAARRSESIDAARALALPAACALELIHTYSLVHDDLPAMDDDTLRRGRPTNHVVFGEGLAILAGDGLLTEAFALLAREPRHAPGIDDLDLAQRRLNAIAIVAAAAGVEGMVGGQAIDLEAAGRGASFDAGGLRAIDAYASELGLAFQIVDDILDVEGASGDLGKTAGKDAAAGKPTYPALHGLDASRKLAAESIERAVSALDAAQLGGHLAAIAHWVAARTR